MKTIAHSPPVANVLRAADALLRAIFPAPLPRHDAAHIAAMVAASGHPSGA